MFPALSNWWRLRISYLPKRNVRCCERQTFLECAYRSECGDHRLQEKCRVSVHSNPHNESCRVFRFVVVTSSWSEQYRRTTPQGNRSIRSRGENPDSNHQ